MAMLKRIPLASVVVEGLVVMLLAGGCAENAAQQLQTQHMQAQQVEADQDRIDANRPLTADTHFAAGQLAQDQGDLQQAVAQYNAALKIDPNHANSLLGLGLIDVVTKQYPQALEIWHRYVAATHGSAAAYSNLGYCLEMMGRPAEAMDAYRAGIAADPTNQPCRVNYGLLLARLGNLGDASEQLSAVLRPAEVHYDLGSVLQSEGQLEKARSEFQAALQCDPDMADARERLAAMN